MNIKYLVGLAIFAMTVQADYDGFKACCAKSLSELPEGFNLDTNFMAASMWTCVQQN
jgi:hypothetical protein